MASSQSLLSVSGPSRGARGLALLLGWTGGQRRHVEKHAPLWHRLGFRTATATSTVDMTFFPSQWTCFAATTKALERCVDAYRQSEPFGVVVPHVFSNGGCAMLISMLRQRHDQTFNAVIYDSAPSLRLHPAVAPLVIGTSGAPGAETMALMVRHLPYSLLASCAMPFLGDCSPLRHHNLLRCSDVNPPRPELFLYSDRDWLIPPHHIEDFIRCRRGQHGSTIEAHRFSDSAHVAHFRTHPEEYSLAVSEFIARSVLDRDAHSTGLEP